MTSRKINHFKLQPGPQLGSTPYRAPILVPTRTLNLDIPVAPMPIEKTLYAGPIIRLPRLQDLARETDACVISGL